MWLSGYVAKWQSGPPTPQHTDSPAPDRGGHIECLGWKIREKMRFGGLGGLGVIFIVIFMDSSLQVFCFIWTSNFFDFIIGETETPSPS